jgi:hypothetical protein
MKKFLFLLSLLGLLAGCEPGPSQSESTSDMGRDTQGVREAPAQPSEPGSNDMPANNRRMAAPDSSGLRARGIGQLSEPDQLYQRFRLAQEKTVGTEMALASMEPYLEMVLAGESLKEKYPESEQYLSLQAEFQDALSTLFDIHILEADGYPLYQSGFPLSRDETLNTEVETHMQYLEDQPEGPFALLIRRMLDDMSRIGQKPENLYAIAAGEFMTRDSAQARQFELLHQGEDVLHILPFDAGKAEPRFLLTYRFFEDEQTSLEFLSALMKRSQLAPQYLMMSCRKGKLYQLGI